MSRKCRVTQSAKTDILECYNWYEEKIPGLGASCVEELDATFEQVTLHPHSWAEAYPGIRRAIVNVYPYLVFFAVEDSEVVVLAVVPAAQDPEFVRRKIAALDQFGSYT